MSDERPRRTWYIEARVGSENHRGDVVRFIDDRRAKNGGDGGYDNRPATDVMAEAFDEVDRLRAQLAEAREDAAASEKRAEDLAHGHVECEAALQLGRDALQAELDDGNALRAQLAEREREVAEWQARARGADRHSRDEADSVRREYAATVEGLRRQNEYLADVLAGKVALEPAPPIIVKDPGGLLSAAIKERDAARAEAGLARALLSRALEHWKAGNGTLLGELLTRALAPDVPVAVATPTDAMRELMALVEKAGGTIRYTGPAPEPGTVTHEALLRMGLVPATPASLPCELYCDTCGTPLDPSEEHPDDGDRMYCDGRCYDERYDAGTYPGRKPATPREET